MINWKKYKLSQIMEIIGGGTPKTTVAEYWNGDIPWLSVVDFGGRNRWVHNTEKKITDKGLNESSTKMLKQGQIIISARGTVGEVAQLGRNMAFNQSCYGLDGNPELVINDFLYYLIKFHVSALKQNTHGAVFDTITRQTFDCIEVELPPLPEQDRIAKILGDLDAKIELNQQMNKTLEAMAQALFKEWFVDFRFPGHEKVKFVDGLPEGWRRCTLGDISTLSAGGDRPEVVSERPSDMCTVPIYSNGIENDGLYGYTNLARIFDESVTVSARGTIGFTCLRHTPYFPIVRLVSLVPNVKYLSATHLYLWLRSIDISGTGTTQQQLTVPDFRKTEILIPAPEIMKRFTVVVSSMFTKITANKNEIISTGAIRDSLLSRLMTGELSA